MAARFRRRPALLIARVLAAALATAALTAALAIPGLAAGHATASKVRQCGLVRSGGQQFQAIETRGSVPCRRVRRVVAAFLNSHTSLKGWHCFDNNASSGQRFAASCARGTKAVVRIYAPT